MYLMQRHPLPPTPHPPQHRGYYLHIACSVKLPSTIAGIPFTAKSFKILPLLIPWEKKYVSVVFICCLVGLRFSRIVVNHPLNVGTS